MRTQDTSQQFHRGGKPMKPGSAMDKAMEKKMGVKPGSKADKAMEAAKPFTKKKK